MIEAAERTGELQPSSHIVEPTSGNTGIALAFVGAAKGYRVTLVIPDSMSIERRALLLGLGASFELTPARLGMRGAIDRAEELATEIPQAWMARQFENPANPAVHEATTGPEIWEQTEGKVDAFCASVGTGGTLAGTGLFLKEQNPKVALVCPDPYGAAMWSWFTKGHTDDNDGDSFAEGIGQSRVTANLEGLRVDAAYRIPDQEALSIIYRLLHEEGIFLGLSSGVNVAGALRYAREHGPGLTITTILCDSGAKYVSKLYNPDWLAAHGLDRNAPVPSWD